MWLRLRDFERSILEVLDFNTKKLVYISFVGKLEILFPVLEAFDKIVNSFLVRRDQNVII